MQQSSVIFDPRAMTTPSQRDAALERAKRIDRIAARSHPDSPIVCMSSSQRAGLHVKREIVELTEEEAMLSRAEKHHLLGGSPLDPRNTLKRFVSGGANSLAHMAALQISNPSIASSFNPLFIHAGPGLGKSHLLQAISAEETCTTLYMTADRFAANIAERAHVSFLERIREIGVILIDDIQFLRSKEAHSALNSLIDAGHQVVIASDRSPLDLDEMNERLRSRLGGGLVVEIGRFSNDIQSELLHAKIAASQTPLAISDEAVSYISSECGRSGREIEGAVNRLIAFSRTSPGLITLEIASQQLRDIVRPPEIRRIKIEDIQRVVARHYKVARIDLLSARRTANVVRPRQIGMYLAKILTMRSLPEIGRRFGGRDHTTVLHAVRKMTAKVAIDPIFADEMTILEKQIQD